MLPVGNNSLLSCRLCSMINPSLQSLGTRMAYMLMKAQLLAKMRMSSQKKLPQGNQVETVPKTVGKKTKNKTKKSAQQLGKIKALKRKVMLPAAEVKLPKPPAGTSTARRLQDPRHSDIVRGLVNVPSLQEMGLKKEGEAQHYYGKMLDVTTRGLSATSGSLYYRYCVVHAK